MNFIIYDMRISTNISLCYAFSGLFDIYISITCLIDCKCDMHTEVLERLLKRAQGRKARRIIYLIFTR